MGGSDVLVEGRPIQQAEETPEAEIQPQIERGGGEDASRDMLFNKFSTMRRRGDQKTSEATGHAKTTGSSGIDPAEQTILDSSRTQDDLTASLVSMAAQLKQQARAFQFSFDQHKGLLDRALEGLDRNLPGVEATSKNMQFLKRMSEGEGWWGRMKLYAMILGILIIAILLVFVGPKFRS
jgi:hypothetical protein